MRCSSTAATIENGGRSGLCRPSARVSNKALRLLRGRPCAQALATSPLHNKRKALRRRRCASRPSALRCLPATPSTRGESLTYLGEDATDMQQPSAKGTRVLSLVVDPRFPLRRREKP